MATHFLGCDLLRRLADFQLFLVVCLPVIQKWMHQQSQQHFQSDLCPCEWRPGVVCVCVCILCVLLYLVTRRLWNTAEAWPAHLSQRGSIAQGLIHRVNKHIICLWTQWRWNKAAHVQFYSWQTHTHTHTHIWGPFMNLGLKATDVVIVHPEITVVWCCGRSGGNLVTYPEQQELLRPHPEHQRLAEESWSSS